MAGSHNNGTQLFGTCQPTGQLQTLEIVMLNVPILYSEEIPITLELGTTEPLLHCLPHT